MKDNSIIIDYLLDEVVRLRNEAKNLRALLTLAEQDACQLRNIGIENIMEWREKARLYDAVKDIYVKEVV